MLFLIGKVITVFIAHHAHRSQLPPSVSHLRCTLLAIYFIPRMWFIPNFFCSKYIFSCFRSWFIQLLWNQVAALSSLFLSRKICFIIWNFLQNRIATFEKENIFKVLKNRSLPFFPLLLSSNSGWNPLTIIKVFPFEEHPSSLTSFFHIYCLLLIFDLKDEDLFSWWDLFYKVVFTCRMKPSSIF